MNDREKTREQLINELAALRQRIAKLEALENKHGQVEEQLRFQALLLDNVRESVVATDLQGNVIYWGKGAEALYGYSAEEVLGKPVTLIVKPEEAQEERQRIQQVQKNGIWRGQYVQQRKDGTSFWADTVISLITDQHGQPYGLIGIDRDITDRKQVEDSLARRSQEMAVLYETSLEVNAQPDLSTLLQAIVRRAANLLQTSQGGLFLMRPDQKTLELVVAYNQPDGYLGTTLSLGQGLSGRVAQTGQPFSIANYKQWEGKDPSLAKHPFGRILGVPLKRGQQVIGVLNVFDEQTGEFDESDTRLLSLFAAQAAIAIENARLLDETYRRAQQLDILNELTREMSGLLEIHELYNTVVWQISAKFDYFNVAVLTLEPASQELILQANAGQYANKHQPGQYRQPLGQGIIGQAAATGQIIVVDDTRQHPDFYNLPEMHVRSEMTIPLKVAKQVDEQVLGVLVVSSEQLNAFDKGDVAALTTIADQLATALERARLFDKTRRHAEQLEALYQVSQDLTALRDLDTLLHLITKRAIRLLERESGGISLYRPDREVLEWVVEAGEKLARIGFTLEYNEGLGGQVWATGQPIIVNDYQAWPGKSAQRPDLSGSVIGVPIQWGNEFLGVLIVQDSSKRPFTAEDATLLSQFATQAAIAIQNTRLHQETQTQAQRVQQILDSVQEGILLLDTEHRVKLANPAAQTYLTLLADVKPGEILTHLRTTPLVQILARSGNEQWHQVTVTGPPHYIFEVTARLVTVTSAAGGWVLVLRDVTQERDTQDRIQRQGRLAAVGQLAAGIAHDFNNILTSIIGYAELARLNSEVPEFIRQDMERVVHQGERAAHLIRQILDFSRQSIAEKRPLDLVPFIKEMIRLLERTIPENIQLSLEIDSHHPTYRLKADPTQIQQALTNLAVNARDAMPRGGVLQFKLSRLTLKPHAIPPCPEMPAGQWITLSISDTGSGIPPEIRSRLFEPFFTTKKVGQGTGLGLSQVYGIIKQHEGYIDVQSEVNQGTTIILYLPALTQPPKNLSPKTKIAAPHGQGEVILLVEDETPVLNVTKSMLEHLGYRVLTAIDGQEALKIYNQHQNDIALILTDVTMPKMSGIALAQALRKQDASINVVAITGYPLEAETKNLLAQGIVDWLQKPLELEQLAQTINRSLKI